ncbi:unnamed protein product [Ixodes persulcatus]
MIECDILAVPLFNLKFSKDTSVLQEYLYALFCRFVSMPLFSYHFYIPRGHGWKLGKNINEFGGNVFKKEYILVHMPIFVIKFYI